MAWSKRRYSIRYDADTIDMKVCDMVTREYGSYNRVWGSNYSTIEGAKRAFSKIKREKAHEHPHHFIIFDDWADIDPTTGYAQIVYEDKEEM